MNDHVWSERAELFLNAQSSKAAGHAAAMSELRTGHKTGHWIWYVFPQLVGLGRSEVAERFGIEGIDEARDYLAHLVLGERLQQAVEVVLGRISPPVSTPVQVLMGGRLDACKLVSSLTLFEAAANWSEEHADPEVAERAARLAGACGQVLRIAGQQGFAPCRFTLVAVEQYRGHAHDRTKTL